MNWGTDQFAGGGFMPSQAGNDGSGGQGQKKNANQNQTLRAVTIKQILRDNSNTSDDTFRVDGIDLSIVTIVGRIIKVEENSTQIKMVVDDGSGRMDVVHLVGPDDSDAFNARKAEWRAGVYVRVYGNLRTFQKALSLRAYAVKPVRDFNEVTYHALQAVFQHLHLSRGAPPAAGAGAGAMPHAPAGAAFPSAVAPHPVTGAAPAPTMAVHAQPGMSGIHSDVLAAYNAPEYVNNQTGADVDDVIRRLAGRYSAQQIRAAVDFLCNEGHLYSTIDDNHHHTTAF